MASASDVPNRYDLVIGSNGYVFSNTVDPSLPFRTQRAKFGYSKTFVERSNIQGDYGDNQQAFWLTATQRDWSAGEQQKYFKGDDSTSARRYYRGTNIDVRVPGQVSMRKAATSISFAATIASAAAGKSTGGTPNAIWAASATNLYQVDPDGTITDRGAHGLGVTPATPFGVSCDPSGVYLSNQAVGGVGTRRWDGTTFSTWSATKVTAMAFLNNTIYGYDGIATLYKFSTAGVASQIYQWQDGTGSFSGATSGADLVPYGGKLAVLRWHEGSNRGTELWIYDGSGAQRVMDFPFSFYGVDVEEAAGILFIGGVFIRQQAGTTYGRPAVWFYQNGTAGLLWQADDYYQGSSYASPAAFDGGLVWNDDTRGQLLYYDLSQGGVQSIGSYTVAGTNLPLTVGWIRHLLLVQGSSTGYYYPSSSASTSATVISSLIDFDSSLTKLFRGITVDFDAAMDGNGGSVDIAYQIGSLNGSWTTLQTGATSGTEYTLPAATSGRSIAVRITLNRGTSTDGPVLKRLYVRAAPLLQQFRTGEYVVDATGRDGKTPVKLRDGSDSPLTGEQIANNLISAVTSATPLSITDHAGTFTGIIEPDSFEMIEIRPKEYLIRFTVRQV